jgi:hypothetical protein
VYVFLIRGFPSLPPGGPVAAVVVVADSFPIQTSKRHAEDPLIFHFRASSPNPGISAKIKIAFQEAL